MKRFLTAVVLLPVFDIFIRKNIRCEIKSKNLNNLNLDLKKSNLKIFLIIFFSKNCYIQRKNSKCLFKTEAIFKFISI